MKDIDYIKKFSKISIPKICKSVNVDYSNTMKGITKSENIKKVRETIESEIASLYIIKENQDEQKTDIL